MDRFEHSFSKNGEFHNYSLLSTSFFQFRAHFCAYTFQVMFSPLLKPATGCFAHGDRQGAQEISFNLNIDPISVVVTLISQKKYRSDALNLTSGIIVYIYKYLRETVEGPQNKITLYIEQDRESLKTILRQKQSADPDCLVSESCQNNYISGLE